MYFSTQTRTITSLLSRLVDYISSLLQPLVLGILGLYYYLLPDPLTVDYEDVVPACSTCRYCTYYRDRQFVVPTPAGHLSFAEALALNKNPSSPTASTSHSLLLPPFTLPSLSLAHGFHTFLSTSSPLSAPQRLAFHIFSAHLTRLARIKRLKPGRAPFDAQAIASCFDQLIFGGVFGLQLRGEILGIITKNGKRCNKEEKPILRIIWHKLHSEYLLGWTYFDQPGGPARAIVRIGILIPQDDVHPRMSATTKIARALVTLLHEMCHALFFAYECPCIQCCCVKNEKRFGNGRGGHGIAWGTVSEAVGRRVKGLFEGDEGMREGLGVRESEMMREVRRQFNTCWKMNVEVQRLKAKLELEMASRK